MLNDMLAQVQVKLILDILKVLGVDSIPATFENAKFSSEAGMSELVTAHVQSEPKHQSLLCVFLESQKSAFRKNKYNYAYDFLGKADQYITNIAESDEWRSLNAQYDSNFYGLNVKDYFSFPDCTCAFPGDLFTGDKTWPSKLSARADEIGCLLDDTVSVQWMAEYKNSSTYYLQQLEQYIKILHELYTPLQSSMRNVNGAITCPPFSELFSPVGAAESPKSWEEFNTQNSVVIKQIKSQLEDYHEWVDGLCCDYDALVEKIQSKPGLLIHYPTLSELYAYDDGTISWQSLSKYRSTLTLAFENLSKDISLTSKTYETSQTQYNVLIERMQAIKDAHHDSMDSDAYEKDILNQSYEEFLVCFLSSPLSPKDATERLNSVMVSLDEFSILCQAVEHSSDELVHAKQNDRRPIEHLPYGHGPNHISSHSSDRTNETKVLGANDTKLFPAQSQDYSFLYVFLVLVLTSVAFCIPYLVLAVPLWAAVVASVVTCFVSTFVGYVLTRYDQTVQATKINDDLELGDIIEPQLITAQTNVIDAVFESSLSRKVHHFKQCWRELVAAMPVANKPAPEGDRDSGLSVSPLGVCPDSDSEELPKPLNASPSSQAIANSSSFSEEGDNSLLSSPCPSALSEARRPNSPVGIDVVPQQVFTRQYDFTALKKSSVPFIVDLAKFSDWLQQRQNCRDLHGFIPLLYDLATLLSDHHKPKQGFFGSNSSDTENFIELCQVDVSAVLPKLLSLTKKPQLLYDCNKASIAWALGVRASTVLKNIDSQLNNKDTLLYKISVLLTQSGSVFSPELLKALARLVIVLKNVDSENLSIAKIGQAFFSWIDQALLNPLQDNVDNYLFSHSALSLLDSNYVYSIRFILRSHLESQVAEGRCQLLPREQTRFYMAFHSLFSSSFFCDATFSSQWKDFPFRDQQEQEQFITKLQKEDCDKNIRDAFQWLFKEFNTTTDKESWLQKHRKLHAEEKQAFLKKHQSHTELKQTELKQIEATVDLRDVFLARLMFYLVVRHAHAILPDICAQNIVGLEGWLATMSKPGESLNPEPQVMKSPAF